MEVDKYDLVRILFLYECNNIVSFLIYTNEQIKFVCSSISSEYYKQILLMISIKLTHIENTIN